MSADNTGRSDGRRWLQSWAAAHDRLSEERAAHLQGLDDESSWLEAQSLGALWEPGWTGDAGEELLLHQRVFSRARLRGSRG